MEALFIFAAALWFGAGVATQHIVDDILTVMVGSSAYIAVSALLCTIFAPSQFLLLIKLGAFIYVIFLLGAGAGAVLAATHRLLMRYYYEKNNEIHR